MNRAVFVHGRHGGHDHTGSLNLVQEVRRLHQRNWAPRAGPLFVRQMQGGNRITPDTSLQVQKLRTRCVDGNTAAVLLCVVSRSMGRRRRADDALQEMREVV